MFCWFFINRRCFDHIDSSIFHSTVLPSLFYTIKINAESVASIPWNEPDVTFNTHIFQMFINWTITIRRWKYSPKLITLRSFDLSLFNSLTRPDRTNQEFVYTRRSGHLNQSQIGQCCLFWEIFWVCNKFFNGWKQIELFINYLAEWEKNRNIFSPQVWIFNLDKQTNKLLVINNVFYASF